MCSSDLLGEGLADLAAAGLVAHVPRPWAAGDCDSAAVVFAATDDPGVNRQVVDACKRRGVLVCAVDKHWVHGDFVTPAILRHEDLVVAISTGGASCRRSRLVKESLSRHLAREGGADLLVLGTDHRLLAQEARAALHFGAERRAELAAMVACVAGVHEFSLIATCNRIELHALADTAPATVATLERLLGFDLLPDGSRRRLTGFEAFAHLAHLAAGLLSQVVGEGHIVAQIKEAYEAAAHAGWAGGVLAGWSQTALHVAKDLRSALAGDLPRREIEDLALAWLDREAAGWRGQPVAVLGAGALGQATVRRILAGGPATVRWFYHHTRPDLPPGGACVLHPLTDLAAHLPGCGAVIAAAGGTQAVLTADHGAHLDAGIPVLDLGQPRCVEAALAGRVRLLGMDDLKDAMGDAGLDRQRLLDLAAPIINDHREEHAKLVAAARDR